MSPLPHALVLVVAAAAAVAAATPIVEGNAAMRPARALASPLDTSKVVDPKVHADEVAANPLRATISKTKVLEETLVEKRPIWMRASMAFFGLTEWADETLCNAFNWACPEPPEFYDSNFGHFYMWALVCANIFVVMLLVSVLGGAMEHLRDPMPRVLRERREDIGQQSLTVLLPCYLPNEHEIMWSTMVRGRREGARSVPMAPRPSLAAAAARRSPPPPPPPPPPPTAANRMPHAPNRLQWRAAPPPAR